ALTDRNGTLWFGTVQGVSSLIPTIDAPDSPPPVRIVGLRTGGSPHPLGEIGETELLAPEVSQERSQVEIDYVGISFAPGDVPRYQYRLEGAEREWSRQT